MSIRKEALSERDRAIYHQIAVLLKQLREQKILVLGGPNSGSRFDKHEILTGLCATILNSRDDFIILGRVNMIELSDNGDLVGRKLVMFIHRDLLLKEKGNNHPVFKEPPPTHLKEINISLFQKGLLGNHFSLIQPVTEDDFLWLCRGPASTFVKKGNMAIEIEVPIKDLYNSGLPDESITLYVRKEGLPSAKPA
jgi:hypothetical protein